MNFTNWLEGTAIGVAVREGLVTYPTVVSLHSVGLGILVGALFIVNVRVLGGFKRLPFGALEKIMMVAAFGFVVNAISGLFLFVGQATTFVFYNTPFLYKIAAIFIGAGIALAFRLKYLGDVAAWDAAGTAAGSAKVLAFVSLVVWSVAIITGRFMAYLA